MNNAEDKGFPSKRLPFRKRRLKNLGKGLEGLKLAFQTVNDSVLLFLGHELYAYALLLFHAVNRN